MERGRQNKEDRVEKGDSDRVRKREGGERGGGAKRDRGV